MRIITGSAKGRNLATLEGMEVRPTTNRVKEALFSIVQFQIPGRKVLDLFAGCGQLGLEALSRGAASAVFIDSSKESIATVNYNIIHTGFKEKAKVVLNDFATYLMKKEDVFDLAFLDPPYRKGLLEKALPLTAAVMNKGGMILCEHGIDEILPETAGDFVKKRSYKYGKIVLTVFEHKDMVAL